mmetsp:Transcript_10405/g.27637  ORF Transcript_10405/g.27637 Transcript_10405/m.27637 type:complete len:338 (+) Transcript_10405:166-1179(+)
MCDAASPVVELGLPLRTRLLHSSTRPNTGPPCRALGTPRAGCSDSHKTTREDVLFSHCSQRKGAADPTRARRRRRVIGARVIHMDAIVVVHRQPSVLEATFQRRRVACRLVAALECLELPPSALRVVEDILLDKLDVEAAHVHRVEGEAHLRVARVAKAPLDRPHRESLHKEVGHRLVGRRGQRDKDALQPVGRHEEGAPQADGLHHGVKVGLRAVVRRVGVGGLLDRVAILVVPERRVEVLQRLAVGVDRLHRSAVLVEALYRVPVLVVPQRGGRVAHVAHVAQLLLAARRPAAPLVARGVGRPRRCVGIVGHVAHGQRAVLEPRRVAARQRVRDE